VKASYEAAALSLPVSDRIADLYPTRDNDSWDTHSTSSTESDILGYYQSSPISSSPRDDASLPSSVESIKFPSETITLKPYPLRIRKSTIGVLASTIESTDGHDMHLLNQFPSTPPPAYRPATPPLPRPTPIRFNHPPAAWLRVCSYERYNADLALFAEMLTNHISTTENMIKTTREAQTMRNFSRKLMNYGDDEEDRAADLKARVARLKATGWRRERFRPDRYQELCERALEEL